MIVVLFYNLILNYHAAYIYTKIEYDHVLNDIISVHGMVGNIVCYFMCLQTNITQRKIYCSYTAMLSD